MRTFLYFFILLAQLWFITAAPRRVIRYEHKSSVDRVEASVSLTQDATESTKWSLRLKICNDNANAKIYWPGMVEFSLKRPGGFRRESLCMNSDRPRCQDQGVCPHGRPDCSDAQKKYPCLDIVDRIIDDYEIPDGVVPAAWIASRDSRLHVTLDPDL